MYKIFKEALENIRLSSILEPNAHIENLNILQKMYPLAGIMGHSTDEETLRELRNSEFSHIRRSILDKNPDCYDLVFTCDLLSKLKKRHLKRAYKYLYYSSRSYILIIEKSDKFANELLKLYPLELKKSGPGWFLLYKFPQNPQKS